MSADPRPGTLDSGLADRAVASMEGPAALPRRNGELVFAEPWEGRAFGLAVALSEARLYAWEEFRQGLIGEIAADEAAGEAHSYYEQWLATLERVLVGRGVLTAEEVARRAAELGAGAGEDHG